MFSKFPRIASAIVGLAYITDLTLRENGKKKAEADCCSSPEAPPMSKKNQVLSAATALMFIGSFLSPNSNLGPCGKPIAEKQEDKAILPATCCCAVPVRIQHQQRQEQQRQQRDETQNAAKSACTDPRERRRLALV